jgi:hypothetical protein
MHYVAYLYNPHRRVEVDGDTFAEARHQAAMLLDTRRERDIYMIETPQPVTTAELEEDTKE